MSYVVGIDPGKTGGIAFVKRGLRIAEAHRYPGDISSAAKILLEFIEKKGDPQLAVIEKVFAMPKTGTQSAFTFGTNFGGWLGILAALEIPHIMVSPQKWRQACFDSGWKKNKDKSQLSLEMARRLFPDVDLKFKADDGKSDALHLAHYGILYLKGGVK